MAGEEELQKSLREAGKTLGHQILWNRQLVFKPGMVANIKTNYRAAKMMVSSEQGKMAVTGGATKPTEAKPASGRGFFGKRDKAPAAEKGTLVTAPASWSAAKPSGERRTDTSVIGARMAPASLFRDSATAVLKMGTVPEVVALMKEGVLSGGDIFLEPKFEKPTFATGPEIDGGPMVEKTINGIADMLRDSGLVGDSSVEFGREIAGEVASCLPIIGAVLTLSEAAIQTVNLALDIYRYRTLSNNAVYITPGQPRAALQAAQKLYLRHAAEMSQRMAINYTAGGASVAGLFLDFGAVTGPLAGIIKTVLNLVITITNTCITLREMRIGNEIIRAGGPFDVDLFDRCPILGTYLLTEADSSALYAFLVGSAPLPGNWMDELMKIKPKVEEVIRSVNVLQLRSPFELASYDEKGNRIATFAKGDHMLDTRIHKTQSRFLHETKLVVRRGGDAKEMKKSMNFLDRHGSETFRANLPGKKG